MPAAILGLLAFIFIVVLMVMMFVDENFIIQFRAVLDMIGWYNSDKKKGWRLVQHSTFC